jgi:hypothetical protein
MDRRGNGDSQFFEAALLRYVEGRGLLHPDQVRRDFFTYARQAKGLSERDARQWAKSQVDLMVTRAASIRES